MAYRQGREIRLNLRDFREQQRPSLDTLRCTNDAAWRRYALFYEKGYQRYSSCTSAVTVKVKGALSTDSLAEDAFKPAFRDTQHYRRVWDSEDIVVPPHANRLIPRRNIPDRINASYLRSCVHEDMKSPLCPIFRVGDMVEQAGADFDSIARKGGVIQIMITWNCDLDYDPRHCLPEYSFLRLDDPDARVAQGFNFRSRITYAKYYSDTTRSLVKAYGINFVVLVRGEAGRTSVIPIAVTLGSGLGLLVVATVLCDFVVIHFDKRKKLYRAKKFKFVSKKDSCNSVDAVRQRPRDISPSLHTVTLSQPGRLETQAKEPDALPEGPDILQQYGQPALARQRLKMIRSGIRGAFDKFAIE
ncbi:hypothetical protein HPB50_011570 [Hyalomma asiaticum]|uniref:Uncharacterized protein n=1 Tax=Hyalomma asiaticum TaxID=266040 RepID=A0ACB7SG30_HYAAI|nr:hypothetical protein HPB50_011570 [Hyalomma asiaticum]